MTKSVRSSLTRELQNVGITRAAIDGVWPQWWSSEAEQSISAATELRYTLARRLGIRPRSLFEGRPKFVWRDNAKFKNLGTTTVGEQEILTSFGMAVGSALIGAAPAAPPERFSAEAIRAAILESRPSVDFRDVLRICWDLGIPVIKTSLQPLRNKYAQAMSVRIRGQHAIIVGRRTSYPAWMAFVIAHELGHIFSGHVADGGAVLDVGDPLRTADPDDEEVAADRFALLLLTGRPSFVVLGGWEQYNSRQVVDAVLREAPELKVDPGVLALCLAHSTGRWAQTFNALKVLPQQHLDEEVGVAINWYASERLRWDDITSERAAYLRAVMGSTSHD